MSKTVFSLSCSTMSVIGEEDMQERKEITRKGRRSGGCAKKKGDRKDVHERKEIGRAAETDVAGCLWQFCNLPHGCHLHILFKIS